MPLHIKIPPELPVMVLPECNLFPYAMLPLYIFEERYRAMLSHTLANSRMFCIGMKRRDAEEGDDDVYMHSTAGIIRACVTRPDGTSNLILQGITRVKFSHWVQKQPFRIAKVAEVETARGHLAEEQALAYRVIGLVEKRMLEDPNFSHTMGEQLKNVEDPEIVADIVGFNFICNPYAQQGLLAIPEVDKRLRFLIAHLNKNAGGGSGPAMV